MTSHVTDRLSAYLDRELPAAERTAVASHLEECADCARRLEELAAVDDAARGLAVLPPEGYFERLPSRVRARLERRSRRAPWALPAWTLAAAAALLLVVVTPLTLHRRADLGPARTAPPSPPPAPALEAPAPEVPAPAAPAPAPAPAAAPRAPAPLLKEVQGKPGALSDEEAKRERVAGEDKEANESTAAPVERDLLARRQAAAPAAPPAAQLPPETPPPAGFAAEPSSTAIESAAARGERSREARPEALDRPGAAGGLVGAGRKDEDRKKKPAAAKTAQAPADRYGELLARTASTAAEAHALGGDWRAFARANPDDPRADEARVRAVEAAALAFRLGGDPADRQAAREEAEAYLSRSDAKQRDRVRALLTSFAK